MRLDQVVLRGTRAMQPTAPTVPSGTTYFVTDEGVTERNSGAAWESFSDSPTTPVPYVDLTEGVPANPLVDRARLYALDVNGYTQVEMRDGSAKVVRLASDNVVIAKVTEAAGVLRGQCVYLAGAAGANALVQLAKADDIATMPTIGLALDTAVMNGFIRVLTSGTLALLDTSAFAEGVSLFVSPSTAGAFVTVLPLAPSYAQRVGFVTRSHATQGEILVLTTGVVAPPRLHAPTHNTGGTDPITALAASVITTGTLDPARLPAAGPPGAHHASHETGGADALVALDAAVLTTGTIDAARLPAAAARTASLGVLLDGAGAVLTTGVKAFLPVPFACTITAVTLLSSDPAVLSGSIVVDIWKAAYASYPPTVANTIVASAKPTLSSATKSQDTTLTGWTKAIAAGDVLGFKVDSVTTLQRVTLALTVTVP